MTSAFDNVPTGEHNARWWLEKDPEERASVLKQVYQGLEERDQTRQDANLHHMRLYGNLPVEGVNPSSYNEVANRHRVTLNVIASVCDFVTARIGKQKPLPEPLTTGGNYSLRRKAKLLKRFFQAQFRISRVYEQARRVFLDAVVFGTGAMKIYADHDRKQVRVERVFPSELLVDHHEALYGEPRQLIQRKWVSKDVLRETFIHDGLSKREKGRLNRVIDSAGRSLQEDSADRFFHDDGVNDQVVVLEAWHLPSAPGAKDGMHTIAVDSGELFSEEWKYDYFPFVFFHWKERLRGFWGAGLAEELNGIQVEINRMLMKIQTAYHMMAKPTLLVNAASKIVKGHINNEIWNIVPYVGEPPKVWTPQSFHPEFYQHLERLYQKAFEVAGITQDTATAQMKAVSGISARTQHDIGTERFSIVALNFEQMFLDIGHQMIDRAKEIAKANGGKFALPAERDRNTIDHIDWSDIEMKEDEYVLGVFPVSSLPTLPSARKDEIIDLMNAGLISPTQGKRLLDYPDLAADTALDRAASDDVDRIIEQILDGDEETGEPLYEPPEPYTDLNLALKKVQQALNKAKKEGVDEERLELLRNFLEQTHKLQQRAALEQQKVAAMAAAQGGGQSPALPPGPGAPPATGNQGAPPTAVNPQDGLA